MFQRLYHQKTILSLTIFIFFSSVYGKELELDDFFINNATFSSAKNMALAGAGCALPQAALGFFTNPAFPNVSHKQSSIKKGTISFGIGRDSLFSNSILPIAVSMPISTHSIHGSIGCGFRMNSGAELASKEVLLNYSGKLFEKSLSYGALDFGATIRYANSTQNLYGFDTLYSIMFTKSPSISSYILDSSMFEQGIHKNHSVFLDIGLYQNRVAEYLDFGITLHNILGYTSQQKKPNIRFTQTIIDRDSIGTILQYREDSVYIDSFSSNGGFAGVDYSAITAGISVYNELIRNKLFVTIPFDVEFLGLFGNGFTRQISFKCGIQALVLRQYMLRFGYARVPRTYPLKLKNAVNRTLITAGFGAAYAPLFFDVYIGNLSEGEWGINVGAEL